MEDKRMKIYLVVELFRNGEPPRILGAFRKKRDAERFAYDPRELGWRNIIPVKVW
jgi:hypothetical protein